MYLLTLCCGCHSLDLCGADSAVCCNEAISFFGTIQIVYNLFSSSPQRWKILKSNIGSSLHGLSGTRWTDRVASVSPLPGIRKSQQELLALNVTTEERAKVLGSNEIYILICVHCFFCFVAEDSCCHWPEKSDKHFIIRTHNITIAIAILLALA